MRKNLFDYATKELSQDAFLRWFLENWNDDVIGEDSLEFVKLLTGLTLKKEDIVDNPEMTKTWSQVNYMDVGFDIYLKDGRHYLIVIEDKAFSNEHHQLSTYDGVLKTWQSNDKKLQVLKVYYKTYPIDPQERERIELVNKDNEAKGLPRWKVVEPSEIKTFFSTRDTHPGSEVLRDYAHHVCKLIDQANEMPSGDPRKWSFIQWQVFFKEKVFGILTKEFLHGKQLTYESWVWRGKKLSCAFYYQGFSDFAPLIEFVVTKDSNLIEAKIHLTTKISDTDWSWKRQEKTGAAWDEISNLLAMPDESLAIFKPTRQEKNRQTLAKLTKPIEVREGGLEEGAREIAYAALSFFGSLMPLEA